MRSKIGYFMIAAVALTLNACAYSEKDKPGTDHTEDNILGTNLSSISAVNSETGGDQAKIAMYDPTVCRIHQFDMSTGAFERSLTPTILGGDHKVMFEPNGNYVIDVVDAHISIFNKNGQPQDPNLAFVGAPKSAAFRPSLGYMTMQDDSKTAAILKIASDGTVSGRRAMGQIVYGTTTMLAGDIDDQGQLILALSDGKIAVVDLDATLANATPDWVLKYTFDSGMTGINWLAPMHDGSHQILAKTGVDGSGNTTIAIFDTAAKVAVGAPYVVPSSRKVIKTSKSYDPHFIVRDDVDIDTPATSTIVYVKGSAIQTVNITNPIRNILSSRVNVASDTWAVVDTDVWKIWVWDFHDWFSRIAYDDYNIVKTNRVFEKFNLSHMIGQSKYKIPDTTQLQIGETKIFQLYPMKAGWARNTSISNPADTTDITKFNYSLSHYDTCH